MAERPAGRADGSDRCCRQSTHRSRRPGRRPGQGHAARPVSLRVLDASVLLACEDPDDDHHEHAVRLLTGPDPLATLDFAYYEVTNVAVRVWRDRAAAERLRERIVALSGDGGLLRADTPLPSSAAAVAEEHASLRTTPRTSPGRAPRRARWGAVTYGTSSRGGSLSSPPTPWALGTPDATTTRSATGPRRSHVAGPPPGGAECDDPSDTVRPARGGWSSRRGRTTRTRTTHTRRHRWPTTSTSS